METKRKICLELEQLAYPIRLYQRGKDRFDVEYGAQLKTELTYGQAAKELGECIFHALACDSKLDNRERSEH